MNIYLDTCSAAYKLVASLFTENKLSFYRYHYEHNIYCIYISYYIMLHYFNDLYLRVLINLIIYIKANEATKRFIFIRN